MTLPSSRGHGGQQDFNSCTTLSLYFRWGQFHHLASCWEMALSQHGTVLSPLALNLKNKPEVTVRDVLKTCMLLTRLLVITCYYRCPLCDYGQPGKSKTTLLSIYNVVLSATPPLPPHHRDSPWPRQDITCDYLARVGASVLKNILAKQGRDSIWLRIWTVCHLKVLSDWSVDLESTNTETLALKRALPTKRYRVGAQPKSKQEYQLQYTVSNWELKVL